MENVNEIIKTHSLEMDFEYLYNKYFERVYKYVSYRVNNKEDVKDLTAEIFQKIYSSLNKYNSSKPIEVWIFSIAKNHIVDYYRKNAKRKFLSIEKFTNFFAHDKLVEDNIEKLEEYEYLKLLVSKLPLREREIISYKFGAELSNKDIAEIMGLEATNVGVIIHRTIKKLRVDLEVQNER